MQARLDFLRENECPEVQGYPDDDSLKPSARNGGRFAAVMSDRWTAHSSSATAQLAGTPFQEPLGVDPSVARSVRQKIARQQRFRDVLIADGPQETTDGKRADAGRAEVGGGRVGAAMHHAVGDLHPRRKPVDQ